MKTAPLTAFALAGRFLSVRELPGGQQNPLIQWWLSRCKLGMDAPDETPWCSAFANGIVWECQAFFSSLPMTWDARARSWLLVGRDISLAAAVPGWDIVVLSRGKGAQPGREVLNAPGHVGFFGGVVRDPKLGLKSVIVRGGNQSDAVTDAAFSPASVLAIKRLLD